MPRYGVTEPDEVEPEGVQTSSKGRPSLTNFGIPTRILLLAVIAITVASYQLDLPVAVNAPAALVFFTVVPGACLMACARKADTVTLLAMSIMLSLSVDVSFVLVGLWAGFYAPGPLLWVLAVMCAALLLARPVAESALRYGDAVRAAQLAAARDGVSQVDPATTESAK